MNRRSVLRWLGLAPVAAPAAVAAAAAGRSPESVSAISVNLGSQAAGWHLDLLPDGKSRFVVDAQTLVVTRPHPFTFDGETLRVPSLVMLHAAG